MPLGNQAPTLGASLVSAKKSFSKFLVAVTVWIASLLSITLFQVDLGLGLQLTMEISMDKLFDLSGVVKHTVLWCLGRADPRGDSLGIAGLDQPISP